LNILKIKCQNCKSEKVYDKDDYKKTFFNDLKISNVNKYYYDLICSNCYQNHPYLLGDNDELIIDPNKLKNCDICNNPISLQRLNSQNNTNLCSAKCIKDIEEKENFRPDIVPSREVPDNMRTCPMCSSKNISIFDYKKKYHIIKCSKSNCTYREKFP